MKYIEEFRDQSKALALCGAIKKSIQPDRIYRIMEFCGGHTHTIHRYGLPSILPKNIELIHGPGCPVCVLPIGRLDTAMALARIPHTIFCSYADILRVPGSQQRSLLHVKAEGADIRMVYSVEDALQLARENPKKEVIFFAIGFETTTPPTAYAIAQAAREKLANFSVFCNHVLTPVAMAALLDHQPTKDSGSLLDGFIGPSHVSIVIGSDAYLAVSKYYQKPIVIAGFEPLDVLQSILMLVKQINQGIYQVENQYTRAVTAQGNSVIQKIIAETLEVRAQFAWRGLGMIPKSGLQIRKNYAYWDAEKRFSISEQEGQEHPQCACSAILRGQKKPLDCKLFAKACTPHNPLGSCMVSSEGACAAVYAYGRGGVEHA